MGYWYRIVIWGLVVVSLYAYKINDYQIEKSLNQDFLFVKNGTGLWKIFIDEQQKAHVELMINGTILAYDIDQLNHRIIWLNEKCNFQRRNIFGGTNFTHEDIFFNQTNTKTVFAYEPLADKYYVANNERLSINIFDLEHSQARTLYSYNRSYVQEIKKVEVDSEAGYLFIEIESRNFKQQIQRMDTDGLNFKNLTTINDQSDNNYCNWNVIPERKEIVSKSSNGNLTFYDYDGKIKEKITSESVLLTVSGHLNTTYWFSKEKNGSERLFSLSQYEDCNDCQTKQIELDVSLSQASDMKVLRSKPFDLTQKLCENPKNGGCEQICTIREGGFQTCICKNRHKISASDPKTCEYLGFPRRKRQGREYYFDMYNPQPTRRPDPLPYQGPNIGHIIYLPIF